MTQIIKSLTAIIVFTYFSNLFIYFHYVKATTITPLDYYILTFGAIIAVVVIKSLKTVFELPLSILIWLVTSLGFFILNFVFSSQSETAYQIFIYYIESIILLTVFLLLFQFEGAIEVFRKILIVIVLLSVLINIYDFLIPTFSVTPGRAAGLYLNPNYSGFILVAGMVASITAVPPKLRLMYCGLVFIGVLVTFSRSGWLLWAGAIAGLVAYRYLTLGSRATGAIIAIIATLAIYSIYSGLVLQLLMSMGFSDLLNPGTISRLGGGGDSFSDHSAVSRLDAAYNAWVVFTHNPWFGAGLGFTRELEFGVSPHNMYLTMAAEGGVVGVIILVSLYYLIWSLGDNLGKLLVILLICFSLFSHNVIEKPAIMMLIAYVIITRQKIILHERFPAKNSV